MHKQIIETKHGNLVLDQADYTRIKADRLSFEVRKRKLRNTTYVEVNVVHWRGGKRTRKNLARYLLGLKNRKVLTDHIDRNPLNNSRSNLRAATKAQNQMNVAKQNRKCSSKYKGACFDKDSGKWYSSIRTGGRNKYLGRFVEEIDAAKAYDAAALKYFGEFACVNFPDAQRQ